MLHVLVTAADVQDQDGGILLLSTLFGQFPFLRKLFADSAYTGPIFQDGAANVMPGLLIEIVKRSDHAKGFVVEPMRWIVERTIGWLGRCRRLAKDWENRNHNALAFLRHRCNLHSGSVFLYCEIRVLNPPSIARRDFSSLEPRDYQQHANTASTAQRRRIDTLL